MRLLAVLPALIARRKHRWPIWHSGRLTSWRPRPAVPRQRSRACRTLLRWCSRVRASSPQPRATFCTAPNTPSSAWSARCLRQCARHSTSRGCIFQLRSSNFSISTSTPASTMNWVGAKPGSKRLIAPWITCMNWLATACHAKPMSACDGAFWKCAPCRRCACWPWLAPPRAATRLRSTTARTSRSSRLIRLSRH